MHVHEAVLLAANKIAARNGDNAFTPYEVVRELPGLNENSVRTHVVSRCCVNAPKNHVHKWDYFRRVGHGKYEVVAQYRTKPSPMTKRSGRTSPLSSKSGAGTSTPSGRRDVIHAVIQADLGVFTAECLEVAVVTQGETLDEVVRNLGEAIALHLDGEDLAAFGLSDHPRVQLIFETPLNL